MKYIIFPEKKQTKFLRLIKEKTKFTWNQLASFLGVSRSMVYFYLSEHSKLPFDTYLKMCKHIDIKPCNQLKQVNIKNKKVNISLPNLSVKLSEFIGALAGDGHINDITYEVSISMDKDLDKKYGDYIVGLFKELFNIEARKYTQGNKTKCFVYSKNLVEFLSRKYGVPIGKKKNKLHIPIQIKNKKNLLIGYIRGVFDTDGSFHRHHPKDAMIGIISRDQIFIEEIKNALLSLEFSVSHSNKNLHIYRKMEIDRFFEIIKPSNMKHLYKYSYYKKYGNVPLTKDMINR